MRFIDAEKISNYIKNEINPYGNPFEGNAYEFGLKLMKYLKNASVDYDVDKVLKQLEDEKSHMSLLDDELEEVYKSAIDDAIEIVKSGGMNNNSKTSD